MEQYKKAEGGLDMPDIDFNKLADEVEKRTRDTKQGFHTSIHNVLREKKIKASLWPEIIDKTRELMKERRPELFPKSWLKKKKGLSSFRITPERMRDAKRHEFQMTVPED